MNRQLRHMSQALRFIGAFLKNKRQIGAILPSSKYLAKAMIKSLGAVEAGKIIVELGPGTGVFTKHLVDAYPDNQIVAVEFGDEFITPLRTKFPGIHVVNGCASELPAHFEKLGLNIDDVGGLISGLPLLSLPEQLRDNILHCISETIPENGLYVQFTYSKRSWRNFHVPQMKLEPTRRVFFNVPPAVVLPFRKSSGQ